MVGKDCQQNSRKILSPEGKWRSSHIETESNWFFSIIPQSDFKAEVKIQQICPVIIVFFNQNIEIMQPCT